MSPTTKSRAGWAAVLLTAIGMLVAGIVWSADRDDGVKDWAAEKDYEMKKEVLELSDSKYGKKEDMVRIEERVKNTAEDVVEIKGKIDDMHDLLTKAREVRFRHPPRRDDD